MITAVHTLGSDVSVGAGEVELARYVYRPYPAAFEAPKPYFHPLRTLAGDVVTVFRPHDHRWHKGLQLTATDVSGTNLWGGHTYVDGVGYVPLDNVGAMAPAGPADVAVDGTSVAIAQALTWVDAEGAPLVHERRTMSVHSVDTAAGHWALDVSTELTSLGDLTFGSPHTNGMTGSGYSGLWWRGPRSFTGGTLLTEGGPVGEDDLRGATADWVACTGRHDEVDRASTLVFAPDPANDGETHWFVRTGDFAGVNPSWAFHRPFRLAPEAVARRRYRVVVATGARAAGEIGELLAALPW